MSDIYKSIAENLRELSRILDSHRVIVNFHGLLKDQCSTIMHNAANVIDELRMNKKEFEDVIKKLVEEYKTSQEENKRLKNSAEFSCISDDIPPIGGIHDIDNYDDLPPIGGFHD